MNCYPRKNGNALRLLAGWCGLLLYVGVFSPVGMGIVAWLGTLDPDHHAILQPGVGGMRLVLRHDGNCSGHHHGTVARALTMFAQPASVTHPDHVLQFSSVSGFTHDSQLVVAAANQLEPIPVVFAEPVAFVATKLVQFRLSPHPPPGDDGGLRSRRTTVLLI